MEGRPYGLEALRTVADYQFGRGAGAALFPEDGDVEIDRSRSGRPRQLHAPTGRLASFTTDGRLTLGGTGGHRLHAALDPPTYRVAVGEESEPFVRDGRNAFAKFVTAADPAIRPGDEVLVVDGDGDLLGVGRAALSADGMAAFRVGVAVQVRDGVAG